MLRKVLYVVLFAAVFILGLSVGKRFSFFSGRTDSDRIGDIMELIQTHYVDSINSKSINERVIPLILEELDPHSTYLSAADNAKESEGLDGHFDGIGVQFNRLKDTVIVTRVVAGGGAERAGMQAGDRILRADTTSLLRKEMTDEQVMKTLKGPSGSVVNLALLRSNKPITAKVVRGPVPVSSIDASYMVTNDILYVRINKWGAMTHQEFLQVYTKYRDQGVKGILLDLRDNVGGYLEAAVALAGEFLPRNSLILYTEGRSYPREDYHTEQDGALMKMPLAVLVNEFSASSSEIFAGTMQDHDRALIIGRRTFGKGLVQRPFQMPDGSVVRLTIARYYIPSGRSIQKKYTSGAKGALDYALDLESRYEHGELFSADSITTADSTRYYTAGKRVVHGGGGITPDVFVPRDSAGINSYFIRLSRSNTLPKFAFDYADKHRKQLSAYKDYDALRSYLMSLGTSLVYDYAYYAQAQGTPIRTSLLQESAPLLQKLLNALIAENVSPAPGIYYQFTNEGSKEVRRGIEVLQDGSWKPKTSKPAKAS